MKHSIRILFLFICLIGIQLSACRQYPGPPVNLPALTEKPQTWKCEIVKRDGRYVRCADGVVRDTATGLEWYAGPDQDTGFDAAERWVESLTLAGGNWRMPTRSELRTLYQEGAGTTNMTPLLPTTGMWVWAGEKKDSSAWTFNFEYGYGHWDFRSNAGYFRAFAVRRR